MWQIENTSWILGLRRGENIVQNEIVTPEKIGMSPQRLERIKPAMQSYVDQKQIAGLSTMIARKGKVVHFEQVGQMDIEANKPMADDAIFRIYSMTKQIICTALMTLYEQGRFHLLDPVAKFIPAFGRIVAMMPRLTQGKTGKFRRTPLYNSAREVLAVFEAAKSGNVEVGALEPAELSSPERTKPGPRRRRRARSR